MKEPRFENITAIVLAGGRSTRMQGIDKSMLPVKGVPMIQHVINQLGTNFSEIIISGDPEKYGKLRQRIIPDTTPGLGPLMGIHNCLAASGTEMNFVTACDIPDISYGIIEKMMEQSEGFDIVMPVINDKYFQPLHALYRKTVLHEAARLLEEGRFKLLELAVRVRTSYVRQTDPFQFPNINNMEDYENYCRLKAYK